MAHSEILITGGRVIDGTGNPWRYADILVRDERIAAITPPGHIKKEDVTEVVDATGKVVCPGFIDIMSHSIKSLLQDGRSLSKITQGVTTEIMGEGWTPAPHGGRNTGPLFNHTLPMELSEWESLAAQWHRFGDWLETMEERGVGINIGSFLGGGTLRKYARGMDAGPSSPEEIDTMKQVMTDAMQDGAFGISYALIYPPDCYVNTEEIIEVCKVVAEHGGIYVSHMRSESSEIFEALDEVFQIARTARIPAEIYHLKVQGSHNWSLMPEVITRIEGARAEGLDITADMYPYNASGTGLTAILPTWLAEGGLFYENLKKPEIRERVYHELTQLPEEELRTARFADLSSIMPIGFKKPENLAYLGKRLEEIAALRNEHWLDTVFYLLTSEQQRIFTLYFNIQEENIHKQLQLPWVQISTDAPGFDPAWADSPETPTHPRSYGTYPRVLGHYVRDLKLLSLEEAIRKMTSSVATRLGIRERGSLLPGYHADVVIFDPQEIRDLSTYTHPHQLSQGVEEVWVNGQRVLKQGHPTHALPGKFLRGPGTRC